MLRKKTNGVAHGPRLSSALGGLTGSATRSPDLSPSLGPRRGRCRRGLALSAAAWSPGPRRRARPRRGAIEQIKSVCTHCAVGCTVIAEVENGVWIGQEPGFDSPINLGAHCAKGAAVREHAHGERRLKYPMKLVDGKWQRISWDAGDQRDRRPAARDPRAVGPGLGVLAELAARSPTSRAICIASSARSGAPTTPTTRRGSVIRPRSRVSPTPGATAR